MTTWVLYKGERVRCDGSLACENKGWGWVSGVDYGGSCLGKSKCEGYSFSGSKTFNLRWWITLIRHVLRDFCFFFWVNPISRGHWVLESRIQTIPYLISFRVSKLRRVQWTWQTWLESYRSSDHIVIHGESTPNLDLCDPECNAQNATVTKVTMDSQLCD